MLRVPRTFLRAVPWRHPLDTSGFASSSVVNAANPNPRLNLDPSLQALLQDVDISLKNHTMKPRPPPRELEAFPITGDASLIVDESVELEEEEYLDHRKERKSPAARFGSQQIGAIIVPSELQKSIGIVIGEGDKTRLHEDAKRLFLEDSKEEPDWDTKYDTKYRSRHQAMRHFGRDGTAFASVALPAHYSAITSVFSHIKQRLGPDWKPGRVLDWGAGSGSGIWASLYTFQPGPSKADHGKPELDLRIANSSVTSYIAFDKREGLVAMGKRLFRDIDLGGVDIKWQKFYKETDEIPRSEGHDTIAMSAFNLTSLPTPISRKAMVKEMWASGANLIVLIDYNTTTGFEAIAESREYLLKLGRKELEDPETSEWPIRGSHVVAPCPHDGVCPLHHPGSTRLVCGFSQRLQRPEFLRLTKHSGVGHEDIGYSYVVVRRGPRPVAGELRVGRIGDIGKWAMESEALAMTPVKELMLHDEHDATLPDEEESPSMAAVAESLSIAEAPLSDSQVEAALRLEAFSWPRLIVAPQKKPGHIILDSCTPQGKIMRITIPKSQGKQPFYDARKSNWGDLFPHEPKNAPQIRYQPTRAKRQGGTTATRGVNIGKRSTSDPEESKRNSYESLSKEIQKRKAKQRQERALDIEAKRDRSL